MKRSTTLWTTALATAALLAMPAAGWAQTGTTATSQQQPPASTEPATQQDENSPREHLRQAKAALDEIKPTAVTGRAKTRLTELKRHVNALERATGDKASATGEAQRSATQARGANKWSTEVAAIDRILTELIGPATATSMTGDPAAATGTTGTTGSTSATGAQQSGRAAANATLDEATRAKLQDVRTHITAYAAAMSGTSKAPESTSADTATTGATSASGTSGTTSATGTSATGSTAATQTTGSQTSMTEAQPTAQADPETARRHLTEARDTLSQLTQLPAAAQLSGEARTQVSQLITNFNALITAQANWRESYDKVEANLNSLLGPETTDEPSRTTATGTATGTAGAVGTSGTAAAAVNLDAAIKAKLVELRQKLKAFEQAAGGGPSASGEMAAAAAGVTTGTATGTATSGTTAGTTAGTAGTMTGTEQQQTPQKSEAQGHSEAMRHIEAIEAILNRQGAGSTPATAAGTTSGTTSGTATGTATSGTAGTTGTAGASLTLTQAQLNELRTHLAELRKLVNQAERK